MHTVRAVSQTQSSAPAGSRDPWAETSLRVLFCVCHSVASCLFKATPPPLGSTSLPAHVTDNTPGSDTDHLLNDRNISLSLCVYPSIPLFMLPSNQWTRACKQKSNRLSNVLSLLSMKNNWINICLHISKTSIYITNIWINTFFSSVYILPHCSCIMYSTMCEGRSMTCCWFGPIINMVSSWRCISFVTHRRPHGGN